MHRMYENDNITIFWDSEKCRKAKVCVTGSPKVFDIDKRPWINPFAAPDMEIWQTVEKCPTRALTVAFNHGIRIEFEDEGCRSAAYDGDREVGGREVGSCTFRKSPDGWVIEHTIVDPAYGGKGIAKRLVYKVVENAERQQAAVIPVCSYAVKLLG